MINPNEASASFTLSVQRLVSRFAPANSRMFKTAFIAATLTWILLIHTTITDLAADPRFPIWFWAIVFPLSRVPWLFLLTGILMWGTRIPSWNGHPFKAVLSHVSLCTLFLLVSPPLQILTNQISIRTLPDNVIAQPDLQAFMRFNADAWIDRLPVEIEAYIVATLLVVVINRIVKTYYSKTLQADVLRAKWLKLNYASLRDQLSPHFLLNALNAIVGLIPGDHRQAERLTVQIGELLRKSLEQDRLEFTTVSSELDFIGRYLSVMEVRYPTLTTSITCDKAALGLAIPTFLLVPVVENSVVHGVAASTRVTAIKVSVAKKGNLLVFTVTNPISSRSAEAKEIRTGVGLANVRQRLEGLYGSQYTFLSDRDNDSWLTTISIPIRSQ